MKKLTRWALGAALALALLVCGALAAEESAIHVQLDGQELTFTDAVPQVKDQRTFLPFRAVFEAMGADVDYEGNVITAVRGDTAIAMTLDETAVSVKTGDTQSVITMDVAPYVDAATWRTYVPVRFAAQALGCAVGWDQEAQTAIVIDVDKLLNTALEGKSFTYLEKLAALEAKYDEGIWDLSADFDADVSVMTLPMTMSGTVQGTTQGGDKVSMDMNMKLDMSQFLTMAAAMSGTPVSAEDQAALDTLKTDGVDLSMRGDVAAGTLYMNMDMGALGAQAGLEPDVWYSLDMAAMMEALGMDWATLLEQSKHVNYLELSQTMLTAQEPNSAANSYAELKAAVDTVADFLCDEGFQEVEGKQVSSYSLTQDDAQLELALALDPQGGYAVTLDAVGLGEEALGMSFHVVAALDSQDKATFTFAAEMSGVTMSMDMEAAYTPGSTAPEVMPPEGATVVPYLELLGGNGMGIIGGADGPTQIIGN